MLKSIDMAPKRRRSRSNNVEARSGVVTAEKTSPAEQAEGIKTAIIADHRLGFGVVNGVARIERRIETGDKLFGNIAAYIGAAKRYNDLVRLARPSGLEVTYYGSGNLRNALREKYPNFEKDPEQTSDILAKFKTGFDSFMTDVTFAQDQVQADMQVDMRKWHPCVAAIRPATKVLGGACLVFDLEGND